MKTNIELLAFKGCESTSFLRRQIPLLAEAHGIEVGVTVRLIHTPQQAEEQGMFGSPTLLRNGLEYQPERRGPAGFYSRAYLTAEGFRPYPTAAEVLAWLIGDDPPPAKSIEADLDGLPALVSADWSPFTSRAERFWNEAALQSGRTLRVVEAETAAGEQVMMAASVAGLPCLVLTPDRLAYGLHHSAGDARMLLRSGEEP